MEKTIVIWIHTHNNTVWQNVNVNLGDLVNINVFYTIVCGQHFQDGISHDTNSEILNKVINSWQGSIAR